MEQKLTTAEKGGVNEVVRLAITADVLVVAAVLTWRFYREGWRNVGAVI